MASGKVLVRLLLLLLMFTLLTGFTVAQSPHDGQGRFYSVFVNNKEVGVIRYAAKGLSIYDSVVEKVIKSYSDPVVLEAEIFFRETGSGSLTSDLRLAKRIEDAIVVKMNAKAVVIEGETLFYLKNQQEVDQLVDSIKAPYIKMIEESGSSTLDSIGFKESFEIIDETVELSLIKTPQEALEIINRGMEKAEEYTVQKGDSLWSIANKHGFKVSDIEEMNPDLSGEYIHPGQLIRLKAVDGMLTVVSREKTQYTQEIDFETKTTENNNLYKGETKIIQKGQKGQKEVELYITRENGKEVSREIASEKVIKEPVDQIQEKGTKPRPAPQASTSGRASGRAADIIAFAKQQLGKPYSSKNNHGPNSFDCSGFTAYVFRNFGINIPWSSSAQASVGSYVEKSQLAPGDLVLFTSPNSGGAVGHVGIYIGAGQFIHATSGSRYCVVIDTLNSGSYSKRYKGARRVLN